MESVQKDISMSAYFQRISQIYDECDFELNEEVDTFVDVETVTYTSTADSVVVTSLDRPVIMNLATFRGVLSTQVADYGMELEKCLIPSRDSECTDEQALHVLAVGLTQLAGDVKVCSTIGDIPEVGNVSNVWGSEPYNLLIVDELGAFNKYLVDQYECDENSKRYRRLRVVSKKPTHVSNYRFSCGNKFFYLNFRLKRKYSHFYGSCSYCKELMFVNFKPTPDNVIEHMRRHTKPCISNDYGISPLGHHLDMETGAHYENQMWIYTDKRKFNPHIIREVTSIPFRPRRGIVYNLGQEYWTQEYVDNEYTRTTDYRVIDKFAYTEAQVMIICNTQYEYSASGDPRSLEDLFVHANFRTRFCRCSRVMSLVWQTGPDTCRKCGSFIHCATIGEPKKILVELPARAEYLLVARDTKMAFQITFVSLLRVVLNKLVMRIGSSVSVVVREHHGSLTLLMGVG